MSDTAKFSRTCSLLKKFTSKKFKTRKNSDGKKLAQKKRQRKPQSAQNTETKGITLNQFNTTNNSDDEELEPTTSLSTQQSTQDQEFEPFTLQNMNITNNSDDKNPFKQIIQEDREYKPITLKQLNAAGRQVVANVAIYMRNEALRKEVLSGKNHRDRCLEACNITHSAYRAIMTGTAHGGKPNIVPPKPRIYTKTELAQRVDYGKQIKLKEIIREFEVENKRSPSLKEILEKSEEAKLELNMSKMNLWRLLKSMGYEWIPTSNNKKVLIDKNKIVEFTISND